VQRPITQLPSMTLELATNTYTVNTAGGHCHTKRCHVRYSVQCAHVSISLCAQRVEQLLCFARLCYLFFLTILIVSEHAAHCVVCLQAPMSHGRSLPKTPAT
jgi:hypothetical protein